MTSKDYVLLADILAMVQDDYLKGDIGADDVIKHVALAFCEEAKIVGRADFDQDRFLARATARAWRPV